MSKGYVKLHRQLIESDFWASEPFTKPQAWVDLFSLANHKPGRIWIRGIEIFVNRGQTAVSELTLTKRWKWSRNKVRNFLKWLKKEQQIEQQKTRVTSLITIINYDQYQGNDTTNETTNETTSDTTKGQQKDNKRYTNKNDKNDKNDNIVSTNVDMSSSGNKKLNHSNEINAVFDYYKSTLNHPRAKLDEKRKRCVRMRLQNGYSVDDIKIAIDGCLASPYHQGENKRNQVYDSLELICRDAEHIDRFIKLAKDPNAKLISAKGRQARQNGQTWLQMRQAKREDQNG